MVSFFFGFLIKAVVLISIGYFISEAIKKSKNDKQEKKLEEDFKQQLIDNAYDNFHPDIEIANRIIGLKIVKEKYIPNIKPRFYFNLYNKNTSAEIHTFLTSLPDGFMVNVPALTISIKDSRPKSIYFWKNADKFQLTYNQDNSLILLSTLGIEELANKIFEESVNFNFQNVSVERAEFL